MKAMYRTYGERVDDRLRLDKGELKDSENISQDEATVQSWGDITKEKRRNATEALKEAYEEPKGAVWRREYHFRSDPRRRDNAPSAL